MTPCLARSRHFDGFTRLSSLCLAALVLLGLAEWQWVQRATRPLLDVPQNIVLVTTQRLHAMRLTSSSIAAMQAPDSAARVPYLHERMSAREALRSSHESLARLVAATAADAGESNALRTVERLVRESISSTDRDLAQRMSGQRGPLADAEIRAAILRNDSLIAAIDIIKAGELARASTLHARLQRGESLVFLLILSVAVAMVVLVLRPAARRISGLNRELRLALEQAAEQAHLLEDSAHELEVQNAELQQRQDSMSQHQQLLMELQLSVSDREMRHRAVLNSMAEGMLLGDHTGRFLAWNASAATILGVNSDTLADPDAFRSALHFENEFGVELDAESLPLSVTLRTGEAQHGVIVALRRPDGARRWLRVNTRVAEAFDASAELLDDGLDATGEFAFLTAGEMLDTDSAEGEASRTAVLTFADITEERQNAERMRSFSVVLEQTDQAIAMTDGALRLTWVNPAWCRITGFDSSEAIGLRPGELLHGPHTASDTVERMRTAVRSGLSFEGEVLNYRKDGTPFWMEVHTTPLRDARGVITSWVSVQRDVTARKTADRERQQLAAALAVTTDGIGIVSVGGGLEFVNHAYARMHGERPRQLIGRSWTQRFTDDEALRLERDVIPQVTRLGAWSGEVTGRRSDGSTFPQDLSITLLPTGGLVCVMRDTSDRKAAEEQLRVQAVRDELTQLYNRRGFFSVATERLGDVRRRGSSAVLLYGDADKFKQVNDTFGHDVGDKVLQVIASVLRDNLRAADVVARLGGDEFTALLVDASAEHANAIVQKIQAALDAVNGTGIVPCEIAMSLGTAVFDPSCPDDLDALMRRADLSLYDVKRFRKSHTRAA